MQDQYTTGGQISEARALRVVVKPPTKKGMQAEKMKLLSFRGKYLNLVEARKTPALVFFITSN